MEIKPQAMAMPSDTSKLPQGKYGPVYPKSPACHGFTIIAKVKDGREATIRTDPARSGVRGSSASGSRVRGASPVP